MPKRLYKLLTGQHEQDCESGEKEPTGRVKQHSYDARDPANCTVPSETNLAERFPGRFADLGPAPEKAAPTPPKK